jgi:putative flippase GtrA
MWIARFHARRRALKAPAQRARRAIVTVQPHQDRLKLLGQVIRFGMVGLLLTVLVAAAYWAVAEFLHVDPMLSMTGVYLVFTGVGYILHSRVSFRDHGARDQAHIRTVRFFITNTLGFISNQFFVWLLVKHLGGPTWWPVIPIIFVTPVLTFTLNRKWVFG